MISASPSALARNTNPGRQISTVAAPFNLERDRGLTGLNRLPREAPNRALPDLRALTPERGSSLRVFGCLPGAGARGCTEAGVRKPSREDMDQKAADELVGIERHKLVARVELGPVILAFEGHLLAVEGDEPAVGDRDPVGVAGQISEDSVGSAEGSLGIDHPFDLRLLSWVRFLAPQSQDRTFFARYSPNSPLATSYRESGLVPRPFSAIRQSRPTALVKTPRLAGRASARVLSQIS
jgi:hypothetical protein